MATTDVAWVASHLLAALKKETHAPDVPNRNNDDGAAADFSSSVLNVSVFEPILEHPHEDDGAARGVAPVDHLTASQIMDHDGTGELSPEAESTVLERERVSCFRERKIERRCTIVEDVECDVRVTCFLHAPDGQPKTTLFCFDAGAPCGAFADTSAAMMCVDATEREGLVPRRYEDAVGASGSSLVDLLASGTRKVRCATGTCGHVRVHSGAMRQFAAVRRTLELLIRDTQTTCQPYPDGNHKHEVLFCGFGHGGSVATLAACHHEVGLVAFCSPRVGNGAFARRCEARCNPVVRVESVGDAGGPVGRLPPFYAHPTPTHRLWADWAGWSAWACSAGPLALGASLASYASCGGAGGGSPFGEFSSAPARFQAIEEEMWERDTDERRVPRVGAGDAFAKSDASVIRMLHADQ